VTETRFSSSTHWSNKLNLQQQGEGNPYILWQKPGSVVPLIEVIDWTSLVCI
jgi:hypothetical protein